jgi:type III secretion protein U
VTEHERTEAPTAHRRRLARQRGQVVHSNLLTSAVAWLAFAIVVDVGAPRAFGALATFARTLWTPTSIARVRLGLAGGEAAARMGAMNAGAFQLTAAMLGWSCGIIMTSAVLMGALQTRAHLRLEAIVPDFGRLLGARAWRPAAARHLAGGIALVAIAVLTLLTFVELAPGLFRMSTFSTPGGILGAAGMFTRRLASTTLVAMFLAGVGDGLWRRARLRRELMMTKDEARRELRELEGDVRLKVERRRRAASPDARAQRGRALFDAAPGDVVVVGYSPPSGSRAVVLRYGAATGPSRVAGAREWVIAAKGRGPLAEQIVSGALALALPVEEDLALATALEFITVGAVVPEILLARIARFSPRARSVTDSTERRS